jgi:hypothetical protein
LRLERDLLRLELEAAHTREQAALEREQAARKREALLLHTLEQAQQQSQRLLDVGRSTPAPSMPGAPPTTFVARGEMRRRIVALLQEHPEGLSPGQTRKLLGLVKDMGSTMKAMARDGLLRRVETGRYVAGESA